VDYRLTKRWRARQRPAPPAPAPPDISARFLNQDEQILIADRLRANTSLRSIAHEPGRAASTISHDQ
jgi:hypothetical protein